MSPAALLVTLGAVMALLAVVANHCQARLALIELALNEGLPPGHDTTRDRLDRRIGTDVSLSTGVHVFLSRSCHACQRLIDELDDGTFTIDAPLHLHYVDRPRPIAYAAARKIGATVHEHDVEVAASAGADPLPYTVAVGEHRLIARQVTPTARDLLDTARNAGMTGEL